MTRYQRRGAKRAPSWNLPVQKTAISGILLTSFSYFLFSLQDASVKWLVVALPVWQILFVRSVTIFGLCLAIGRGELVRKAVRSPVLKPMFLRNVLLLAAWLSYYNAARDLGLAELTTLYYASPIVMTLLSVPVLREVVPLNRWVAVLTGFVGVLIACNIFGTGLSLSFPVYLALQAAVFWAVATVLLRKTALQETTLVQMTISSGFFIVFTGTVVPFAWTEVALGDLALMAATGALAGIAQFALFEGMRRAPVSMLAPFEYSSLVWAFALGFLIWGDVPAANVFLGAALIFSAGMIIIAAERWSRRLNANA
ncbi:DMT family transporter [Sinorhizobium sp. BG8]|uniref:DMT family transporter n=1 Tax=Sinorhizobium sp. BG8 TaxID=2613773 RepID=UPI00193E14EA|nr:DMT family transporter [Sinorhizobium sp. BG8]QRM54116.1 DMT family transporter [Sinorhizobium sp. BG8]